jgi:hypothetical protein
LLKAITRLEISAIGVKQKKRVRWQVAALPKLLKRILEAIWKELTGNQATFLFFFGYLKGGCLLFTSGRRRRVMCWMAAIWIQVSLEEVSYS